MTAGGSRDDTIAASSGRTARRCAQQPHAAPVSVPSAPSSATGPTRPRHRRGRVGPVIGPSNHPGARATTRCHGLQTVPQPPRGHPRGGCRRTRGVGGESEMHDDSGRAGCTRRTSSSLMSTVANISRRDLRRFPIGSTAVRRADTVAGSVAPVRGVRADSAGHVGPDAGDDIYIRGDGRADRQTRDASVHAPSPRACAAREPTPRKEMTRVTIARLRRMSRTRARRMRPSPPAR